MKIGILGGTFDPIHQGHLLLARSAQKQYQLDKILFVPALIPPHKTNQRDMTPAPYRYRMVEMALKNQPPFELSDIEFNRPEISYTVETLKELKKKYPHATFFLIMGSDAALEILTWKEPEAIQKMATILVAQRPGFKVSNSQAKLEWIQMPEFEISASQIREKLSKGEKLGIRWLPEEVENYIHKMNLYQKVKRESLS